MQENLELAQFTPSLGHLDPFTPKKINVQEGQPYTNNESKATIKHGRPLGFKDKNPQKWKGAKNQGGQIEEIIIQKKSPEGNEDMTQEETKVHNSSEDDISLNYVMSGKIWNRDSHHR